MLCLGQGCSRGQGESQVTGVDSLYTLDYARDAYYERADYATARHICNNLLDQPEVMRDSVALEEVCSLLALVAIAEANNSDALRYATRAERLARGLGHIEAACQMQAYVGDVLNRMGQVEEGRRLLESSVNQLRGLHTCRGHMAYISVLKKQIYDYSNSDEPERIPPLCEQILARLQDFKEHASDYGEQPERFDAEDFDDFIRGQVCCFMAIAHADMGHRQEAIRWLHKAEQTHWSQTIHGIKILLSAYESLGMWSEVEKTCRRLDEWSTDTLSSNYVVELKAPAHAAEARGRMSEALRLKDRISNLQEALRQKENNEHVADLASIYHLQDVRMEQQKATAAADRRGVYLLCCFLMLVLATGFALYYRHQRRVLNRKNRALANQISEAIGYKEKYLAEASKLLPEAPTPVDDRTGLSNDELFSYVSRVVEKEQLFLDPGFCRQTLIDRFHLTKEQIGAAFSSGSVYDSISEYTNERRLQYSCTLLLSRPDVSLAEVATASGFTNYRSFGRSFKQAYGLTPTEYRRLQGGSQSQVE